MAGAKKKKKFPWNITVWEKNYSRAIRCGDKWLIVLRNFFFSLQKSSTRTIGAWKQTVRLYIISIFCGLYNERASQLVFIIENVYIYISTWQRDDTTDDDDDVWCSRVTISHIHLFFAFCSQRRLLVFPILNKFRLLQYNPRLQRQGSRAFYFIRIRLNNFSNEIFHMNRPTRISPATILFRFSKIFSISPTIVLFSISFDNFTRKICLNFFF